MSLIDLHTHRPDATDAVISLPPGCVELFVASNPAASVSTGTHPWSSGEDADFGLLERVAALPQVVAIGEAGLDRLRGAPIDRQIEIFRQNTALSERLRKPLVIHCVRAWSELMGVYRALRPSMPWAIHGFRGRPELARQLLQHGFYLSLGEHYNPASALIIPDDRLLVETDESAVPVAGIIARLADIRGHIPPVAATLDRFLHSPSV